jgi:D-3-phosphoglycerate dehydrogenase
VAAKVPPETRGLVSADMLRAMRPDAYFINTARAAIVDYDALIDSLKTGAIAGAALDVYPAEPLSDLEGMARTLRPSSAASSCIRMS